MAALDILIRNGRLDRELAESLRHRFPRPDQAAALGEALVAEERVTAREWLAAVAEDFAVPFLERIDDTLLDPGLVENVPVDWVRARAVLPVRYEGQPAALTADPSDLASLEDLGLLLGEELQPLAAPRELILQAVERCFFRRRESASEFLEGLDAAAGVPEGGHGQSAEDLLRMADGAPVTRLVNLVLLEAVKAGASDVHIEPYEDTLRVRYRVDGMLYEQASPPKHMEAALASRLKVMARLDIAERRLPQDGMARVRVGEREIDIRVSTVPVGQGERIVLRLLNRDAALLALSELGMPETVAAGFRAMLHEPQGLVLVTGPTGSGKTTTLYAALRELDTGRLNVLTIEDPIEYQLSSISQIQVNPKIDLTFARCLRHVLRQDPDVVLVGETRDLETAEIAIRASLTGHLVFSTLHTNDAIGAAVRMVDMGLPAYLLAAALKGVLAQRLVRRLCPACRRADTLTAEDVSRFGEALRPVIGRTVYRPGGCAECRDGYRSRTGIYDLLVVDGAMTEALRAGASPAELRRAALAAGWTPMHRAGLDKVLAGETSPEELARVVGRLDGDAA